MGVKKKTGKNRLDKYYHLAKEQGYRARSAFKLIQLNRKYNFLEKSRCLIDLCAAPGGWLQVASKFMPVGSLIIGCDLVPIKAIPRVTSFADDITSDSCRTRLRSELKTWNADVVLHDGAPNVGSAWVQDAYSQAELVLHSLKLAVDFLKEGGVFVTKVFRSQDYNNLLWVFNQLFQKVEATKPASSRNESAEIFVVCLGYLKPKTVDPKLLNPSFVFKSIEDEEDKGKPAVLNDLLNPEKRKRHREGYAENDYILFRTATVGDFIFSSDPIPFLAENNELKFTDSDQDKRISESALTVEEIRELLKDLKVLGRKDFKTLLKWREKIRKALGLKDKKEKSEQVVELNDDLAAEDPELIAEALTRLSEEDQRRLKRISKLERRNKMRELKRMELGMTVPMDVGMEQEGVYKRSLFKLPKKAAGNLTESEVPSDIDEEEKEESEDEVEDEVLSDSDAEMEAQLTRLEVAVTADYDTYQERIAGKDPKILAKRAIYSQTFHGTGRDSDDEISEDEEEKPEEGKLSGSAAVWFDQPIFKGVDLSDDESPKVATSYGKEQKIKRKANEEAPLKKQKRKKEKVEIASDNEAIEEVPQESEIKGDASFLNPASIALAHQLIYGRKTKEELIDENFRRDTFLDPDNVPAWFRDDERKFNTRQNVKISKEAVKEYRERVKEVNARPIKKVLEAKARKKKKAVSMMNRLQSKANAISENPDLPEKSKAQTISQLMKKAKRKIKTKKDKVQVVVSGGKSKGPGRPSGVRGRYKVVDARLKKDVRAQKVKDKKKKNKRK